MKIAYTTPSIADLGELVTVTLGTGGDSIEQKGPSSSNPTDTANGNASGTN
jgi:hypothetical protein